MTVPDTPQPPAHWTLDQLNTTWGVRWQEQFHRAEAAEVEVDALREALDGTSARCREEIDRVVAERDALRSVIRKRAWNLPLTETDLDLERRICDAWPLNPDTEATK